MRLRQESGDGVDVLAVAGRVAHHDARELATVLETTLHGSAQGVVVDLGDVTELDRDAADALRSVAVNAAGWPRASLCLCGAPAALEELLHDLVVHASRDEAIAHLDATPRRRVVPIEHSLHGPAQARRVVAECAARLGLDDQGDDLVLVVSEMVTNAVRHGEPPVQLEVAADDEGIVVAVVDGSVRWPQSRDVDEHAEGGRGMTLVDLLASEHGVDPRPPGKTVWARVRRRAPGAGLP